MRRPAAPGRLEADVSSDTSQMSHQFLTVLPSAANAFCPQQPWSEQNRRFQDVPPEWSPKCSAHHPADQADDQVRLQAVEAKGSGSCQLEDRFRFPSRLVYNMIYRDCSCAKKLTCSCSPATSTASVCAVVPGCDLWCEHQRSGKHGGRCCACM